MVEAMAVGIPVVSTNISGIPELVEDGVGVGLPDPDREVPEVAMDLDRALHGGIHGFAVM